MFLRLPWHGRGHRFDPDQVHQLTFLKIQARCAESSAPAAALLSIGHLRCGHPHDAGCGSTPPIPNPSLPAPASSGHRCTSRRSARFLSSSPHRSANRLDTSSSTCHTRPIFWLSVDDPARQLPAAPPPPPSCDRPPSDPLPLVTPPATYGCCRGSSPPWSKSPYRRSSGAPEGR